MSTKRELELEIERMQNTTSGYDVRVALPLLLFLGILGVGSTPIAAEQLGHGFSPLLTAFVALPLTLAGWRLGFALWPRDIYGDAPENEWHLLVTVTGVGAAVALPYVGYLGVGAVFWPLAAGVTVFGLFLAGICWGAPRHAARMLETTVEVHRDEVDAMWRRIYDDSDLKELDIVERRQWESGAGFTLVAEPSPTAERRLTYTQFAQALPAIVANADYRLKRADGTRILPDCVIAEQGVGASELLLHVRTRNVFAESVDFPARTEPGDIADGIDDVGLAQDGEQVHMAGATIHTKIVGRSGGGKSNLANVMIARTTDKANALVWICASTKLIPLVFPWLLPWFTGRTEWPVIDYIAGQSRRRILMMLRNAYMVADERNRRNTRKSKRTATAEEPAIIVFLDEASDAVEDDKAVIVCHDGLKRNISALLYAISRVGRSTNVSVKILTQVGLVGAMGTHGTELMRNLVERVCLATMSPHDGPATLPALPATVDCSKLRDHSAYIQPSTEAPRLVPWKPYYLDGDDRIVPVAIRNTAWMPQLEERSQVWNEPGYRDRWHPDALPELYEAVIDDEEEDAEPLHWPYVPDVEADDEDDEVTVDPAAAAASVDREERLAQAENGTTEPDEVDRELDDIIRKGQPVDTAQTRPAAAPAPTDEAALFDDATDSGDGYDWRADGARTMRRLEELNASIAAETDRAVAESATERTGPIPTIREGRPVPPPLAEVIEWLERVGYAVDEVRTGVLAANLEGYGDTELGRARLGRELSAFGLRTKNVRRDIDERQRKGYRVSDLREAATRHRFQM